MSSPNPPPFLSHRPPIPAGSPFLVAGTILGTAPYFHLYAWDHKLPDRARWQALFDDGFSIPGVQSTQVAPAFGDETRLVHAFGGGTGFASFSGVADPGGGGLVLFASRAPGRAELYAAVDGEPLAPWKSADGGPLPVPMTALRFRGSWYFMPIPQPPRPINPEKIGAESIELWRVDESGIARPIHRYPRPSELRTQPRLRLVRKANGASLGILAEGAEVAGPGLDGTGFWYVLPIDPDTGGLDEIDQSGGPIPLGPSDLSTRNLRSCVPKDDGWLIGDLRWMNVQGGINGPDGGNSEVFSRFEARVRVGESSICIEALRARIGDAPATIPSGWTSKSRKKADPRSDPRAASTIPMTAIEGSTGDKLGFTCLQVR